MDIESQNKELLRKNNEKLDELCKKICLCMGWSLVLFLFLYSFLHPLILNHSITFRRLLLYKSNF